MTLTSEARTKILSVLLANRSNFEGSDSKYAASFNINKSVFARMKSGETERLMNDTNWISIARRMGVQLGNEPDWLTADTAVYLYITEQLQLCQMESLTSIYCDVAGIGKSYTAKQYVKRSKNAVYVDCSQVKSKQKLIRFISHAFGLDHNGKYSEVYENLVYYLKVIHKPLIILDEAGDLDYPAFLELKALWNATEHHCGWYMMGADGLQAKIDRGISCKKVGFTEIFNRYGSKYNRITPFASDDRREFMLEMAATIIEVNSPNVSNKQQLIVKTNYHLRNLYNEIIKHKRASAA
ncbi:MAG TPA: ATP-binding protein [Panacibacter sp.]|nr:ATP-binding protein [Panacibacter sp.]HNP46933.1 ATP-binding protein [Panacibacter sp.]